MLKLPQLRSYQVEALAALLRNRKCSVVMPTGTGKTLVALAGLEILSDKLGEVPRTLIIVPTIPLLKQWRGKLLRYGFPGRLLGEFYTERKVFGRVTLSIYNSVAEYVEDLKKIGWQYVVYDEIHHAGAEVFSKSLELSKLAEYALGLTATMKRNDLRHQLILKYIPIRYVMTIYKARRGGWVSGLELYAVPVKLTWEEWREYDRLSKAVTNLQSALSNFGERSELRDRLMAVLNRRKQLLSEAEGKPAKVAEILERERDAGKILLFSESIQTVESLYRELSRRGYRCYRYHSGMGRRERDESLSAWKNHGGVMLAVRCLDEGLDVPECGVGIIVASGTTVRQLVQRLGRLIRPRKGKTARLYVVYAEGTVENRILSQIRGIWSGRINYF